MVDITSRQVFVALFVGGLLVPSAAVPATAAAPDVAVRVDGTALDEGASVTVTEDPQVAVEVSAESPIDTVSIRVDGESRRTFSPDGTSFSTTVTLDVADGSHDLTVVASASETTSQGGTVVKDAASPRVRYTSPFTTSRQGAPSDTETVAHGNVTLAGDLYDQSGVESVYVERVYEWKFAGKTRTDKTTYRLSDPGDSFARPLLLGPGTNRMKVRLTDVHGQTRIQTWTIDVEDRTDPRIRVETVERLSDGSEVRVSGTVSDDTKVQSLSYEVGESGSETSVLTRTDREPTRERLSADFEFTASAGEGVESLTLVAKDTAGNTLSREVSLNFEQRVNPTISVDEKATVIDGDQVHVVGTVSSGRVTRVTVETVAPDGEVVGLRTVHDGEAVERVEIDERLEAAGDGTEVVVRAVDTMGRSHRTSIRPRLREPETTGGAEGSDEPTTRAATTTAVAGNGNRANRADPGNGGFSFPLTGPAGLAAGALALVGIGLVVRWVRGGRSDAGSSVASTPATDPTDEGRTARSGASDSTAPREPPEGASGPDAGDDSFPESPPDFLDADTFAAVDESGVSRIAERLHDDDPGTVAAAAGTLGRLAADRPDLDLSGEKRLRDLRVDPNAEVRAAAKRALERFDEREE